MNDEFDEIYNSLMYDVEQFKYLTRERTNVKSILTKYNMFVFTSINACIISFFLFSRPKFLIYKHIETNAIKISISKLIVTTIILSTLVFYLITYRM